MELKKDITKFQKTINDIKSRELELNNLYSSCNDEHIEVPDFYSPPNEEEESEGWSLWNLFKEG